MSVATLISPLLGVSEIPYTPLIAPIPEPLPGNQTGLRLPIEDLMPLPKRIIKIAQKSIGNKNLFVGFKHLQK